MSEENMAADDRFVEYLKEHPRMMSALAGMLALLTQAGNVIAAGGGSHG